MEDIKNLIVSAKQQSSFSITFLPLVTRVKILDIEFNPKFPTIFLHLN